MKWINHDQGYLNLENIQAIEIEFVMDGVSSRYKIVAYDKNQRPYWIGLPYKTREEAKETLDRLILEAKDVTFWSASGAVENEVD